MNKFIIVRHGETNENLDAIMQGKMNTNLNKRGINQAKKAKEKLKNEQIDLIVSSPLNRAKDTALIISNDTIPVIFDDRLMSRDHGEFQGMSREKMHWKDYWNYRKNIKYKKAENVREVYKRAANVVKDLKEKYPNKTIAIVTHSGICRVLHFYFEGIPEDGDFLRYKSTNCSIEKYITEEEK